MNYHRKALAIVVSALVIDAFLTYKQNLKSQVNLKPIHNVLFLRKRDEAGGIECAICHAECKSTILVPGV